MTFLWIALGGGLGALSRYALSGWVDDATGPSPLGILVVNVSGAFLLGFFGVLAEDRFLLPPDVRRFVVVGLLGGYTTFSTLTYETMKLLESGDFMAAATNGLGSLLLGLVAAYLGMAAARLV